MKTTATTILFAAALMSSQLSYAATTIQVRAGAVATGGGVGQAIDMAHQIAIANCNAQGGTEVPGSFTIITVNPQPPGSAVVEITCQLP